MYLLQRWCLPPVKTMGNISVDVTDGENAISGATVTLTDADSQTKSETTDEEGNVLFEDVDNGEYTLEISKEGYATITESIVVAGVDLDLDATLIAIGDLTITVDDGTNAIEGATVVIGETTQTTDSNGEVEFGNMPYEDYTATISKEGYTTATETIAFRSNHKSFTVSLTSA